MKLTFYSSLFSMYARIAGAESGAVKQEININKPVFSRVGIKFVINSAGELYPGEFVLKNIYSLTQKEITSHL